LLNAIIAKFDTYLQKIWMLYI